MKLRAELGRQDDGVVEQRQRLARGQACRRVKCAFGRRHPNIHLPCNGDCFRKSTDPSTNWSMISRG
jgi:hypothetical protein